MGEFTDTELELLNYNSRYFQTDIDRSRVADLVNSPDFEPWDFQLQMLKTPEIGTSTSPETWSAFIIKQHRNIQENTDSEDEVQSILHTNYVYLGASEASMGLQIIKDLDEFWRFKTTVDKIFELSESQLNAATDYFGAFRGTDYESALRGNKKPLIDEYKEWKEDDLSTENIKRGISIYENCVKITERGFPHLLAVKRILDGETPDLQQLHHKKASDVRRELEDSEEASNSVFFDLIVGYFDSNLRNGIAHNDIISVPVESVVRIPTENAEYDYKTFNEKVRQNIANAIFVAGTFGSLIEWHTATRDQGHREERPDWVFGESSVPGNMEFQ